ncbi:hypothetical protein [Demequina iriomotensis]|uniref:hypothetical protein n=1 Tax=Demequina iriomotensis TaxID=1536641 RepID=UPI0007823D68|nr:hypothetical protein [Demequina iriomotensis]
MGSRAWFGAARVGARRLVAVLLAGFAAVVVVVASALPGAAAVMAGKDDAPEEYPAPPPPSVRILWAFQLSGPGGGALLGGELHRGDAITLHATGLPPGGRIAVELHSTPLPMGSGTVDATGDLTVVAVVPEAAEAGAHQVVATLTADGFEPSTATAAVTLVDAAPAVVPVVQPLAPDPVEEPAAEEPPAEESEPVATPEPAVAVAVEPAPDPTDPVAEEPVDDYPWLAPTIPTLGDLHMTPLRIAGAAALASAFLLLAGIPAELLQSTLTENYSRAFGWLAPHRRGRRRSRIARLVTRPWLACGITVALATLILGLGQTEFRFGADEAITYVSLWLSLSILNLGLNAGRLAAARGRLRVPGRLMPLPGALIVVTISVVISETLHIEPALLFGVVVSVQYGRAVSTRHEGRLALLGVSTAFTLGVVSWILLSVLESTFAGSDALLVTLAEETLAGTVLETLAAMVVGLLPFTYLDGKAIHDWSRRVWAVAYFVAAIAFVLIAVPTGEDWNSSRTPLLTWLLIVGGFGAIALSAWAAFRFIPERHAPHPAVEEAAGDAPAPAASSTEA